MAEHSNREAVETEAQPDGRVLCPLPECGKMLGAWTPERSQYYCRFCKIEVFVRTPNLEMRLKTAGLSANLSNPDKRQLIAMILASDLQASANRSRALELIGMLPDDECPRGHDHHVDDP